MEWIFRDSLHGRRLLVCIYLIYGCVLMYTWVHGYRYVENIYISIVKLKGRMITVVGTKSERFYLIYASKYMDSTGTMGTERTHTPGASQPVDKAHPDSLDVVKWSLSWLSREFENWRKIIFLMSGTYCNFFFSTFVNV